MGLVIAIFTAYAPAHLDGRFTNTALAAILATTMFPEISMIAPQFEAVQRHRFAELLPGHDRAELEEAAQIDGCSPGQAFRKVILPLAATMFSGSTQYDQPFGTPMAAGVIVTIPLVITVLPFQRRIVSGLTAGGVT